MKRTYTFFAYIYRCIELYLRYFISLIFRLFPVNSYKIVVCSYFGNDYSDNPKYIVENILKNNKDKKYIIVWALRKELIPNNVLPKDIKIVKYGSISYLYDLATAKVWIDNARKVIMPLKRKTQYYFQVWHGSMPLKKVEFDTKDTLTPIYIKKALIDNKNVDFMISGSKWTSNLYRTAFNYTGKIIEKGIPRDDLLFNNEIHEKLIDKVYSYFNIPSDYKIVLYAPTFRNNKKVNSYLWDYNAVLKELESKYNKSFILLIRLHPNVAGKSNNMDCFNDKIINATSYPDMQELLIASEILITDYSSSMFDFGMIDKKCLLYTPDIDSYLKEREFYFDIRKLPFPLSETETELIKCIDEFDDLRYHENLKKFYDKIDLCESGKSAEIIASKVMEVCNINEKK